MRNIQQYIGKHLLIRMICVLTTLCPTSSYATEKGEFLAKFLYNLTDYINWGDKANITICTYGYDEIVSNLSNISTTNSKKKNRVSPVESVKILNINMEQLQSCNFLYISQNEEKNILLLIEKTKNLSILTVSSTENFTVSGGMIEFQLVRQKIHLKVNQEALNHAGISLSPVILMSARPE